MRALQILEPGKTTLIDRDIPEPGPGEALLRVRRIGICGTDLNTFRGLNPLVTYPRIPGHEIGAVVQQLGPDAPGHIRTGQEVLVVPYNHCGKCSACRQKRYNTCRANQTLGVQREGAMCEYFVVGCDKLRSSEKLSLAELALVEPLSVGFHACRRGRIGPSDTVAVLGCGAIGLGVIAGAVHLGARVVAIDIDEKKLQVARACGAAETVHSQQESLHDRLQALTAGEGPDVVVEAIGLPATFQAAVEEVSFAGRVVYIGYAKAQVEYETKLFVMKELDILGSRNALPGDFEAVIAMLEAGRFPIDQVVTRTVPLDQAGAALQAWSECPADVTKIHVELDAP
jgi:2-desacetyl-2-hydroxyethyl bacteriochlorophyllide A dehydrogenase